MTERKAIYYGQVELIPGTICDGYILDDGTPVLSERGTADLLEMEHGALKNVEANWPQKTLNFFTSNKLIVEAKFVQIILPNCTYFVCVLSTKNSHMLWIGKLFLLEKNFSLDSLTKIIYNLFEFVTHLF